MCVRVCHSLSLFLFLSHTHIRSQTSARAHTHAERNRHTHTHTQRERGRERDVRTCTHMHAHALTQIRTDRDRSTHLFCKINICAMFIRKKKLLILFFVLRLFEVTALRECASDKGHGGNDSGWKNRKKTQVCAHKQVQV